MQFDQKGIFFFIILETLIVDTKPLSQEEKDAIERANRLAEDEILARQLAQPGEGAGSLTNGILLKQVVDADNSCLFTRSVTKQCDLSEIFNYADNVIFSALDFYFLERSTLHLVVT